METKLITTVSGREVSLQIEDRMYIDGSFVTADDTFLAENPSTNETLAELPIASREQVDRAVQSAQRASKQWRELGVMERRDRVEQLADAIVEAKDEITNLDVADNGSCISKMQDDAEKGAKMLDYFAGIATELKGETIPTEGENIDFTKREPYGVIAGIIPFNHPAAFVVRKIGPAIVAGNGIVIKPSEFTSLSALYLARVIDSVDAIPDGLVNIVTGPGNVGAELVEHGDVGMVTMIGSVETGKKVMQGASKHLAPVVLELGGKNPTVVFPDKDPEEAAEGAAGAMNLAWQGQSCGSGSRLLVHEDIYDDVVSSVVERFEAIEVGDPFDHESSMGSIVSEPQFEKVVSYVETAKEEGATLLTGGDVVEKYDTGYFFQPTVFEVDPNMTIANEEIFGPVLSVMSWNDYDEMIEIANGVDYGLTASVWTDDLRTAYRTVDDLEAGYIWVNQHGSHFIGAPFGGYKQSGIGTNESVEELLDHTRIKNVNVNLEGELTALSTDD
ncbi:aldehyde dehydrogenase family protein [Saliphagus sp. GCM10025334]